jgi:hypothetical protein
MPTDGGGSAGFIAADLAGRSAGEVLTQYLQGEATTFLRALTLREADSGPTENGAEAGRLLSRAARRIAAALHTYGSLTDPAWAEPLSAELGWLSTTLACEHEYAARLDRLLTALNRLADPGEEAGWGHAYGDYINPNAGTSVLLLPAGLTPRSARRDGRSPRSETSHSVGEGRGATARTTGTPPTVTHIAASAQDPDPGVTAGPPNNPATPEAVAGRGQGVGAARAGGTGPLAVGAARAGALLDRQLTLARTRAHSAALQAMGSSRFHAVADAVAMLASEVALAPAAAAPAPLTLPQLTQQAHARLAEAAAGLPLARSVQAYSSEALRSALGAETGAVRQDAPWERTRILVRIGRYALELCPYEDADAVSARLVSTDRLLERHREAAEAAAAVAAAARTPRIVPATAYALGVLHADQRHEVESARFAFARLWH